MLPEGEDLDEWLSVYGNFHIHLTQRSGEADGKVPSRGFLYPNKSAGS